MEQPPQGIQNTLNNAREGLESGLQTVKDGFQNLQKSGLDTINNVSERLDPSAAVNSVKQSLKEFADGSNIPNASSDFLTSNSLVAKFGFLLLVVILFMLLFYLGIYIITYFVNGTTSSPYVIPGLISGNDAVHISQDPKNPNGVTLPRSNNQLKGAEFSWSLWLNVTGVPTTSTYANIFNVGNNLYDPTTGIATVNNGPGLYVQNNNGAFSLLVVMDVVQNDPYAAAYETVVIQNIPLKIWFHCLIRLENNVLDIYINGVLTTRLNLTQTPRLNYNDIYVCQNGGFTGSLSNLRYYSYAMSVLEVQSVVRGGPNTTASSATQNTSKTGQSLYLSNSWYQVNQTGYAGYSNTASNAAAA